MRRTLTRHIMIATAGTLLLAALLPSRDASAMWRMIHAINCKTNGTGVATYDQATGQVVNATASPVVLICPVEADTVMGPTYAHTTLSVTGYANGTNGIQVKTCVTWRGGGGGYCPPTANGNTGAGVKGIAATTTYWKQSSSYDYAYLWVQLGGMISGSANVLFGAQMATL